MKRVLIIILVILATWLGIFVVNNFKSEKAPEHLTRDLFEDMESWK